MYHGGYPVKVTTAMKETMEAKDRTPELRVCCLPPDTLPSDTRLHRLLPALLGVPPWPWIAIAPAVVAKFKYPTEYVAHRCPGHPNKGPLYYSLGTAGTVPAELDPALRTHLREHHGDLALLAPHGLATDRPQVLAGRSTGHLVP